MWWWQRDWAWAAWLAMTVGPFAFRGQLISGVVRLVRSSTTRPVSSIDAEVILAVGFAAGEIDDEEYQRRRDTMRAARDRRAETVRGRR